MSVRDMWKMFHLLNNTSRDGLTREELRDVGVDCYSDTLMELASRGGVTRTPQDASELWTLTAGARAVLNTCTVARKLDGAAEVQVDRARVFCVMPFTEPWSHAVWTDFIEPAITAAGLNAKRGDTTLRTGNLIQNVWNEILESGCIIAELSAFNPNVYYELGMAHGLGRDAFVLVQQGTNLPADLKGSHYLEYDPNDLAAATRELQRQLEAWRDDRDIRALRVEALFS